MPSHIIDELSKLASNHKLVPFLGSGCSKSHLNIDWDSISLQIVELVDEQADNNLDIAQYYVEKYGKNKFCEFLKEKLMIDDFDDEKGSVHTMTLSFNLGVIYTTNQDNVMEKCIEKYGRNYKSIIDINDLAASFPSDNLYIKFHGDINDCESVIFSREDYDKRMADRDHFLNIRLKSDLLTKSLFFIGYSLRDDNVNLILKELNNLFGDNLPNSYMLAWEYSKELEELCRQYGIKLIDPLKEFPNEDNNPEISFEEFLSSLLDSTIYLKRNDELNDMLMPKIPPSMRVLTHFEITSLNKMSTLESFDELYNASRGYLDRAIIPPEFEKDVVNIFERLSFLCSNEKQAKNLGAAAFHLKLQKIENKLDIFSYVFTTTSYVSGLRFLHLHMGIDSIGQIFALIKSVEMLDKWNMDINDNFRNHMTSLIENGPKLEQWPEGLYECIEISANKVWKGRTTLENPLKRKARLEKLNFPKISSTLEDNIDQMVNNLPKKPRKPYE